MQEQKKHQKSPLKRTIKKSENNSSALEILESNAIKKEQRLNCSSYNTIHLKTMANQAQLMI